MFANSKEHAQPINNNATNKGSNNINITNKGLIHVKQNPAINDIEINDIEINLNSNINIYGFNNKL